MRYVRTARSEAIDDQSFIKKQWDDFCQKNKRSYLHSLYGKPGYLRRLAGKLNLLHFLDSREVQRTRLNIIRCESHREALITELRGGAGMKTKLEKEMLKDSLGLLRDANGV